ncbi:hypothetical protein KKH23_05700 [Patescibacteria group bacterium]|nr:hypothetical protein [Patescibacteria group bacterium]
MPRIQFRLSEELNTFVEERAKESKITPSEYLRLLIVREVDDTTRAKNLALEEVNKQLEVLQKDVVKLQDIKKLLSNKAAGNNIK